MPYILVLLFLVQGCMLIPLAIPVTVTVACKAYPVECMGAKLAHKELENISNGN